MIFMLPTNGGPTAAVHACISRAAQTTDGRMVVGGHTLSDNQTISNVADTIGPTSTGSTSSQFAVTRCGIVAVDPTSLRASLLFTPCAISCRYHCCFPA